MGKLTNYVEVDGVREHYQTGTSRDYDEWMSDDSASDGFEATMDSFGAVSKRKNATMKRAQAEADRRKQVRSDIDSNKTSIAANKGAFGDFKDKFLEASKNKKEEPTELSETAKQALSAEDGNAGQGQAQPNSYDFLNKKMGELKTSENTSAKKTTDNLTYGSAQGTSSIEDYNLNLSYDPDRGANPKSKGLMNSYKDNI